MAWLDRLEAEHDNLAAAISWLPDQDQPGPVLQLSAMTWQYWWLRGHTEESARYGEVIVASGLAGIVLSAFTSRWLVLPIFTLRNC